MDGDKIKDFFIHHFEKMILFLVVCGSGFLIYLGTQAPDVMAKHNPDRLEQNATSVRAEVDEDHNSAIIPDRTPTFDIVKESERVKSPVDPSIYAFIPLEPPYVGGKSGVRRSDPVLLEPRNVEVHGVMMAMAVRSKTGEYPYLTELEDADPVEKVEKKKKRRRSRNRGGDSSEDMMMMGGMEDEGGGGRGGEGGGFGGFGGMDMLGGMEEGLGGNRGGGAGGVGGKRMVGTDKVFGYRPKDVPNALKSEVMMKPIPKPGWFIAGTAAIPYKELYEAYQAAFEDAPGYDPAQRDRPIFLNYEVQRADITDKSIDELVDADWVQRDGKKETILDAAFIWAGFAPELVPEDYRDPEITMWIPPVMMDDYAWFALNSAIPSKPWATILAERNAEPDEEIIGADVTDLDDLEDQVQVGASNSSNETSGMMEFGGQSEEDSGMLMGQGGGGLMGTIGVEKNPPEFKLVRFFDFANDFRKDDNAPKRGRTYVYRVRVAIEDPNFPVSPLKQPPSRELAEGVYTRISALKAKVIQEGTREPYAQRFTPWSKPSAPISLPGQEKLYAGPVVPPKMREVVIPGGKKRMHTTDFPTAKMVVDHFAGKLGTRVGVLMDVMPGSVLSKEFETADVVDPISLEVKKVESYDMKSSATVLDIFGGDAIEIHKDDGEDLLIPGGILVTDSDGNLKVHEEADEIELYRIRSFADERGE